MISTSLNNDIDGDGKLIDGDGKLIDGDGKLIDGVGKLINGDGKLIKIMITRLVQRPSPTFFGKIRNPLPGICFCVFCRPIANNYVVEISS